MPPIKWRLQMGSEAIIGFIVTVLAVIAGVFVYTKYLAPMMGSS
jgi:hypothetical protein